MKRKPLTPEQRIAARARTRRYDTSDRGRAKRLARDRSARAKRLRHAWLQTEKGLAYWGRYCERQKLRLRAKRAAAKQSREVA